jgi:hypothetical protein
MGCEYSLLPAQRKFIEIPHDYKIDVALYQGGYGSGKTFSGSLLGTLLCLKYPRIRGLVGAQTIRLVTDTTMVSYLEHFEKMGIKYTHNKSENKITLFNGSELLFRHLEEPDKIKSLNLGFVEIEEMSDTPESTFNMLLSRLRQAPQPEWEGFRYRLFGHTNPEKSRGWIYERFVKEPEKNFRRVLAPTTDNIYLPEGFVDMLKSTYSEEYYNINVLGNDVDNTLGLVTKGFNYNKQVRDCLKINKDFPIHLTCDFNKDPMAWYIAQHYDGNVYYLHEIVQQHTTTEFCAGLVAELLTDYKSHAIIINGDASGKNDTTKGSDYIILKNTLAKAGFKDVDVRVMNKNPEIGWRINCWNSMMKDANGDHRIFIHPQCKYLLYNIDTLEMEEGGNKPKKISSGKLRSDEKAKYLGHPIDACSYLVCLYYPIKDITLKGYNGKLMDVFGNKYQYGVD